MLNARANSALDDIIAARMPGLSDLTRLVLKCMVMDLLYLELTKQMMEDKPEWSQNFRAWSGELAARTQAIMNTNGLTKQKQDELAAAARKMAVDLQVLFQSRVMAPTQ